MKSRRRREPTDPTGLLTDQINLHGTLQVDNKLSKGSTGVKSVLLKSLEPLLKKNVGEIVPIKIGGAFSHSSYGLDVPPLIDREDEGTVGSTE
jgi:hypothetical protein